MPQSRGLCISPDWREREKSIYLLSSSLNLSPGSKLIHPGQENRMADIREREDASKSSNIVSIDTLNCFFKKHKWEMPPNLRCLFSGSDSWFFWRTPIFETEFAWGILFLPLFPWWLVAGCSTNETSFWSSGSLSFSLSNCVSVLLLSTLSSLL